ncbi:hypothetical protein [Amaricoccus solimangrovi]|uniref:Uncharacterized protein n=1 Tax=Amaricoccus solimangrovi TaxID=2589815 RepID=A0A501X130_9RHOB|nr:hypothetical protein [Amaricoccus solimangrovi]TPE53066.1 hypothetical protein FJM51_03305 [Amaricoccus solimangrovi]
MTTIYQTPNNIIIRWGRGRASVVIGARYRYTEVDQITVRAPSVYDAAAPNRVGGSGAFGRIAPAERIEAAVATLRKAFGPLPTQCNLPDDDLDRPLAIETVADSAAEARK